MAVTNQGVWGIDLGQCALKAIRLEFDEEGAIVATAFDYVEHPKILSQPDADPDELTREALTKFLERNTLRGDIVGIGVPGQSGLARFVKLPPVEEKKIADIVRFEAKQQIPFNLDEVVWDYQKIGSGGVTDGFAMDTEIGLFAMKRDMIGRSLQHFKDVGVEVQIVQMAPLALCNYVAYDLLGKGARAEGEDEDGKKTGCVVALDIGADSSNLVITDGDRVIWQRPIPLGGNHFTRALTKEMKLTFAKAEHLKRNATKSPDLKKILSALKPVLNDFVGEVQRSLGYFTNTHRNAQIDYMIGLGNAFRLPGLQKYLGEKLQLEVRKVTKMNRLTGDTVVTAPTYTENILSYGVAYGLALQGLKDTRIQTNLLPGEIRTERLVKAKKPYAAAAAAVLLLGIGAMAAKAYWGDTRPWGDAHDAKNPNNPVNAAIVKSDAVTGQIKTMNDRYDKAKGEANRQADALRSIVAGQDEQLNWIDLMKFIGDAIPKPDGSNWEKVPARAEFWDKKATKDDDHPNPKLALSGAQAWKEYQKQIASTRLADKDDVPESKIGVIDPLGRGIDDRVQFNVEMVNARYCSDLGVFWNNVSQNVGKETLKERVRPETQAKAAPTGKGGWIVEVHGYTFHYKKFYAVRDLFAENIAEMGVPPQPAAPTTTPGGTASATPTQPVKTPAPADDKANTDPVKMRLSHVIVYKVDSEKTNEADSFSLIKNSVVADLVSASGGAGAGGTKGPGGLGGISGSGGQSSPASSGGSGGSGGAPPMPGAGGGGGPGGQAQGMDTSGGAAADKGASSLALRDSWTPLGSITSASGGTSGGSGPAMPGMGIPGRGGAPGGPFGGRGLGGRGPGLPGSPTIPGLPGTTPAEKTPPTGNKNIQHERTEFIILFVWQEPTPSDHLRGIEEPEAPKQP